MNFENIHNYYEKLVIDHLTDHAGSGVDNRDQDFLEDVACVALNRLPTRYVRYDVDTAFYMSDEEHGKMQEQVRTAVKEALEYVRNNP